MNHHNNIIESVEIETFTRVNIVREILIVALYIFDVVHRHAARRKKVCFLLPRDRNVQLCKPCTPRKAWGEQVRVINLNKVALQVETVASFLFYFTSPPSFQQTIILSSPRFFDTLLRKADFFSFCSGDTHIRPSV